MVYRYLLAAIAGSAVLIASESLAVTLVAESSSAEGYEVSSYSVNDYNG